MAKKKQKYLGDDLKLIAEQLDVVEKLLDRTKVLYEQYFMGIQKMPPAQLHRDIERKVRELTQLQIRNTSLRYRLTNVTQKFGVYNTYWRRILRQIEQGRYVRDIARAQRRARRRGEDVPEEILAAMPRRMRDRVLRDRALLARRADREDMFGDASEADATDLPAHAHQIDEDMLDDDVDIDALFANLTARAEKAVDALNATPPPGRARPPAPRPERLQAASPQPAVSGASTADDDAETQPFKPLASPQKAKQAPPPIPVESGAPRKRAQTVPPPIPVEAGAPRKRAQIVPPPIPAATRQPGKPAASPPARMAGVPGTPAPRSSVLPPGMTEAKARALYQRFLQAREQVGKSTDVRYDDLMKTLNRQAPALMKQHNATAVEFDVTVQGDKVILKAKPRR